MTATRDDWAVAVQPGDVLKISATYDTSRASWYESMGLAVVWMYNGPGGDDPFVTKVDQPGVLTHGHLPENNNHGGKKTTLKDPRKAAVGPADRRRRRSRTSSTATATSPPASRSPTVAQGQSITFDNLDADGQEVWHSITSCKAPCTASTGVAYPLADGDIAFDSGQLGDAGAPDGRHRDLEHARRPRPSAPTPTSAACTRSCAAPSASSRWVDAPTNHRTCVNRRRITTRS